MPLVPNVSIVPPARTRWHIKKLEQLLRAVSNDAVEISDLAVAWLQLLDASTVVSLSLSLSPSLSLPPAEVVRDSIDCYVEAGEDSSDLPGGSQVQSVRWTRQAGF